MVSNVIICTGTCRSQAANFTYDYSAELWSSRSLTLNLLTDADNITIAMKFVQIFFLFLKGDNNVWLGQIRVLKKKLHPMAQSDRQTDTQSDIASL